MPKERKQRLHATPHRKAPKPCLGDADPVDVYCRIRPLERDSEECCVYANTETKLVLSPSSSSQQTDRREIHYSCKRIFETNSTQASVFSTVAYPLVKDFLFNKNGLLFTYGVTGSGKTFTMTGRPNDPGLLPRALDMIFNSIGDMLAKKYTFKPDRKNGFTVQSEADALLDRQRELNVPASTPKIHRKMMPRIDTSDEDTDTSYSSKIEGLEDNAVYAVFVTYVEIYNNRAYDLLEELPSDNLRRPMQPKELREDASKTMFVYDANEVEVTSATEAFDLFCRGQNRRRVGFTALNAESSRSHSIFNIRLVQAPIDAEYQTVNPNRNFIAVSQLSLVDLAGSERTNRTNNAGDRLREAGNINNSLMTLRSCMEILRENQTTGSNKMVPYRDSKITHMFKSYFEGEGKVKIIICINPRSEDYDENIHVLRFAEVVDKIEVPRSTAKKRQYAHYGWVTPSSKDSSGSSVSSSSSCSVFRLHPPFPLLRMQHPEEEHLIPDLVQCLEQRQALRKSLLDSMEASQIAFRKHLIKLEEERATLLQENNGLKAMMQKDKKTMFSQDKKIVDLQTKCARTQQQYEIAQADIQKLKQELGNRDMKLKQNAAMFASEKAKLRNDFADKAEKLKYQMKERNRQQQALMEKDFIEQAEKERLIKDIIEGNVRVADRAKQFGGMTPRTPRSGFSMKTASSESNIAQASATSMKTNASDTRLRTPLKNPRTPAVANKRHRRSRSADAGAWVDHRPTMVVPLGTVLQPYLKNRKSVTKLTDVKDFCNKKTSNYCLTTQDQDNDGDMETKIFKGDVIPTAGGGVQVVFNDVEVLKQVSPTSGTKRCADGSSSNVATPSNVADSCSVGIEGHASSSYKKSKTGM